MDRDMKESLLKVKNMVKVYTYGKTVIATKVNLFKTKGKDQGNIIGAMEEFIKENGRQIV